MGRNRLTTALTLTVEMYAQARTRARQQNRTRQTNYQVKPMSYFRTPEHRAQQSKAIQIWQPWAKSTGPRSAVGKAVVARNAVKHGGRSAELTAQLKGLRSMLA